MNDKIAQKNKITKKNDRPCCMWLDDMKGLVGIKCLVSA